MKKLLGIILVFSLLSSLFVTPAFSASQTSVDVSREEALLSDLGIVQDDADLSKNLTRGEFADYICKLLNIVDMPSGYKLPYNDVPETHQYYKGIYNIYAWRLISDSSSFRPDDLITVSEASKIVVSALGYDFMAIANGGYPGGYISAATQLGVMPNGDAGGVSRASAYVAMYNMLHTKLPTVDIGTDGNNKYQSKTGDTLLGEMWNLFYDTGVVEDGQFFGINNEDGVGEGKVVIGGYLFKNGGFDTDSMIGDNVDVYYDKDAKIVSVYAEEDSSSKTVTLLSSQDISYSNRVYSWYENDEEETRKISKSCVIVYNGKKADFSKDIMDPEFGSVKLIYSGSSEADIVVIKSYTQAVVGAINTNDRLVSDVLNPGTSYVLDDDITVYQNQNGTVTGFDSIAKNDVLWIAQNPDGEYTDVIICRDYIEGQITGTSPDSNSVYIDNRKFDATESVMSILSADFQLGSIVKGLINPNGEIIYLISQNAGSEQKVGFLMYSRERARGLSYEVLVKILGTDNAIVTYTLPKKFLLNGVGVNLAGHTDYEKLPLESYRPSSMKSGIITFTATPKNELTSINYAADVDVGLDGAKNLGLFPTHSITDTSDEYVQFIGDDRAIVNKSNEKIFVNGSMPTRFYIPTLDEEEAIPDDSLYKYQTFPKGYQTNKKHYGYSRKENSLMSDFIVTYYSTAGGSSGESIPKEATLYMVTDISQIINDEGIEVEQLTVQTAAGVQSTFYSTELGYVAQLGLEFGDLVKVVADIHKNLQGIQLVYKAGEDKLSDKTTEGTASVYKLVSNGTLTSDSGNGNLSKLVYIGDVYRNDGTFFELLLTTNDINAFDPNAENAPLLYGFSASRETITLVNTKSDTYSLVGGDSLKSFYDFGSECSRVVIETQYGTTLAIFAYEK
ncbi:MAG: hypothetical protein IJB70_04465 [Clostridia bacterium]|nr:hypothetical protein [Clostridia bacterium]